MTMAPGLRKLVLTVHLTTSVGWIGAVVAYLALGLAARNSADAGTVRAAWVAMELAGWYAIVPLALGALLTGVVISLGTPWGLFRHYWVVISLVLTVLCAWILLAHMPSVSAMAALARAPGGADLGGDGGDLLDAGGSLVVLLAVAVLNVYKPRGLTPYGWREQQQERARQAQRAPAAVRAESSVAGR